MSKKDFHALIDSKLQELIDPTLLTRPEDVIEMFYRALDNVKELNVYALDCLKKYAKLSNKKIFTNKVTYEVDYIDYYVSDSKENVELGADCMFSEEYETHDGEYDEQINELTEEKEK